MFDPARRKANFWLWAEKIPGLRSSLQRGIVILSKSYGVLFCRRLVAVRVFSELFAVIVWKVFPRAEPNLRDFFFDILRGTFQTAFEVFPRGACIP